MRCAALVAILCAAGVANAQPASAPGAATGTGTGTGAATGTATATATATETGTATGTETETGTATPSAHPEQAPADGGRASRDPALAAVDALTSRDTVGVEDRVTRETEGLDLGGVRFELHGYARMPLAAQGTPREPFLVDNDYYLSGFAYTRLYEPDWSELFFSATRGDYKAEFGIFASLYSDYASPELENQLGIAQASVTARRFLGHEPLSVQVGVFWDRFGHLEPYDTYVFGRTHQGGFKASYALPGGGSAQLGVGIHQDQLQQNLGMTPIAHLAGTRPIGPVVVGGYVLRTWTRDQRQLSPIQDGTMWVVGADARVKLPRALGTAYAAFAFYHMSKVLYLAPALEVMHSTGGRGLTENFLGLESSEDGTGRMYTVAADAPLTITPRIGVRAFGMATWVRSKQVDEMDPAVNRDRRLYIKWGVEPSYLVHPKIRVSARFDRVIMDLYDRENGFRVLSPKIAFPLDTWGELFLQYSHYWYGDKVHLRPGQVPLVTEPDADVVKVQAQVVW